MVKNNDIFDFFTESEGILLFLSATIAISVVQLVQFYIRSLKDFSISYRIAVIGLPRAGKTALIGAIFNHMFRANSSAQFNPVGQETIHRVNRIIANLNSQTPIKPTMEKDIFVFRFIFLKVTNFFRRKIRYEGEVVDFPGELSQRLLDSAEDGSLADDIGIFHKEFFSWVLSSRVHIFAIDIAKYLTADDRAFFVAQMTAEIRAAWQLLNEELHVALRSEKRRVALVFCKSDLLSRFDSPILNKEEKQLVLSLGYDRPRDILANNSNNSMIADDNEFFVTQEFDDLISYFTHQPCLFKHIFVSSYGLRADSSGIDNLVKFILPN